VKEGCRSRYIGATSRGGKVHTHRFVASLAFCGTHTHTYIHTHAHKNTHIHIHKHIHTHTYTHTTRFLCSMFLLVKQKTQSGVTRVTFSTQAQVNDFKNVTRFYLYGTLPIPSTPFKMRCCRGVFSSNFFLSASDANGEDC
jgi:hypothetical protein